MSMCRDLMAAWGPKKPFTRPEVDGVWSVSSISSTPEKEFKKEGRRCPSRLRDPSGVSGGPRPLLTHLPVCLLLQSLTHGPSPVWVAGGAGRPIGTRTEAGPCPASQGKFRHPSPPPDFRFRFSGSAGCDRYGGTRDAAKGEER